jgi:hypothetical protein
VTSDRIGLVLRRCAAEYGLIFPDQPPEPELTNDGRLRYRCFTPELGTAKRSAAVILPVSIRTADASTMINVIQMELARVAALVGLSRPGPALTAPAMTCAGTFRVHFNRHGAAPLVWCVATDEWELAIASIVITGAEIRTVYKPKATPDDEDGKPSAWLEVTGVLTVVGGEARITRGA